MTVSNVVVSIDRTDLALPALEISGEDDARELGLMAYQEPSRIWRVTYAPDHPDVHGSEALSASLQQGVLSFEVFPKATDEATARTLIAELETALGRFSYTVTTTVGNAAPRVWTAEPGAVVANGRSLEDLITSAPVFDVSIPVYPIAS